MGVVSMKQLLEVGIHSNHQTRRWNLKTTSYIYTKRNGIHTVDLQKTVGTVDDACKAVAGIAATGSAILFAGTKKQAQDAIKEEAERRGQLYVNERWPGGMPTNFKTIQSRVKRLRQIEEMSQDSTSSRLPKKEVTELKKELEKLEKNLGGIKDMKKIPDAIVIIDPKKKHICVTEACKPDIPLIGTTGMNSDSEELTCVIPGNDDAICAVRLTVSKPVDAVTEAHQGGENCSEEVAEGGDMATGAIRAAIEANAR